MKDSNVVALRVPTADSLGEVLKEGTRQLLAQAIEAELAELLAQKKWRRLRGYKLLAHAVEGVKFKDGERLEDHQSQGTTDAAVHQI